MRKKVSLKDIAAAASVSTAAVSYVLNGQEHRVATEMAEKIKSIATRLNYQPNQIAKSLKTRKTHTIGLIVANISYRFTTGITHAIEAAAKENRYTVIFGSSDEQADKFEELVNVLLNRQVDGLILVPSASSQPLISKLQESGIPFVLIDRYFPEIPASHIALDNFKAAHQATRYILQRGRRNVFFVNYNTSFHHLKERSRGVIAALEEQGIKHPDKHIIVIEQEKMPVQLPKAMAEKIRKSKDPVAFYFATDTLAINGLKYLQQQHHRVPEDVWVVSFDGAEAFELFPCPVTHGAQPLDEMGRLAVDTLLALIDDPLRRRQHLLDAVFVAGKSCSEK